MRVVKLLTVQVQPTFVIVDTDTGDVVPGPHIQPADIPAGQLGDLPEMFAKVADQIEQSMSAPDQANTSEHPSSGTEQTYSHKSK